MASARTNRAERLFGTFKTRLIRDFEEAVHQMLVDGLATARDHPPYPSGL